jgi:hypothetical protein
LVWFTPDQAEEHGRFCPLGASNRLTADPDDHTIVVAWCDTLGHLSIAHCRKSSQASRRSRNTRARESVEQVLAVLQ